MKKTVAEQIADLEATRAAKQARMEEVMTKSLDEGRTTDEAEAEEVDTIDAEIKAIDSDLVRLKNLQRLQLESAKVVESGSAKKGSESRVHASPRVVEKLAPGILFARHAMCVFAAKGDSHVAARLAHQHYGETSPVTRSLAYAGSRNMEAVLKATVAAGTTQDAAWAQPLVEYVNYSGDFVEYLRGRTILGQFGTGSIPALRRIPFNVHIKGQTVGGTGYWVGEGKPKPVTAFGYNDTYHGWYKTAAIAVLTDELIRFSDPSAENLVRDALAEVLIERMDTDFINPSFAGAANVSPASITNGAASVASTGNDADAIRADLVNLWGPSIAARNPLRSAVYVMHPNTALRLSLMRNALGQPEFPGLGINGGSLEGVPVLVSDYVPYSSAGTIVVLINAQDVYFSDDGQATVDFSREASIQMLDNPTNASDTGTPTTLVSMFQTDSTALRAHRFVNWSRRRPTGVTVLTGVNWGE
jgi:HK97 family phage major capsid protein